MERSRNAFPAVAAVLCTLFLIYPNRTALFAPDWIIFAFSTASVTLLALGAVLCFPDRLAAAVRPLPAWLRAAFCIFAFITLLHCIRHAGRYSVSEAAAGFVYPVLPLFACVFAPELRRALPPALALLWCWNAAMSLLELLNGSLVLGGLAMNKNWNAALLLCCMPFALLTVSKYRNRAVRTAAGAGIALLTLILGIRCGSAGALVSVCLTSAVLLLTAGPWGRRRKLMICLVFCAAAAVLLVPVFRKKIPDPARNDRMFLYRQTLFMIADAPVLGHGVPSFEQAFLPFRTADYFTLRHSAGRIDHPHNHLLFIAAGTGLAGLAAWLALMLVPMMLFIRRFREAGVVEKVCFASFLLLFFHSQFDLILFKEPMNLIAFLMLGMFWHFLFPAREEEIRTPACGAALLTAAGLIFCLGGLTMAGMNLYASVHFRAGERCFHDGDGNGARRHYRKCLAAAGADNSYYYRYPAADKFSRSPLKEDRETALEALNALERSAIPDYGHIHQIRGRLLLADREAEGAQELIRDAELYPLDPVPLIVLMGHYVVTGKSGSAAAVAEELNKRFKQLGLDAEIALPFRDFPNVGIDGEDGTRIMTEPGFDFFRNVIR